MAERLGKVLYWAGCLIAVALVASGIAILFSDDGNQEWFALGFVIVTVLMWLLGKAPRYILAGR